MSVSPTDDALVVALDFEGELAELSCVLRHYLITANDRRTQFGAFSPRRYSSRSF